MDSETINYHSTRANMLKHGGGKLEQWLYEIVRMVWLNEELPDKWKEGIICPIHKKFAQMVRANYCGISLLNLGYKLLSM
jgi:hypothetical protein